MTSLIDFLEARLAEDEAWARLASAPPNAIDPAPDEGVHWDWVVGPNLEPLDMPDPASKKADGMLTDFGTLAFLTTVEKFRHAEGDTPAPCSYSDGIHDMEGPAAAHIVRHDPARVLREVKAKRRVLERHTPTKVSSTVYCDGCPTDQDGFPGTELNDCPELQGLAFIWNEYEDWNQAWCPHIEGRHEVDVTELPPARGAYTNACNRCGQGDGWHYRDRKGRAA